MKATQDPVNSLASLKLAAEDVVPAFPVYVGATQQLQGIPGEADLWWWDSNQPVVSGLWDPDQADAAKEPSGLFAACATLDADGYLAAVDCNDPLPALCQSGGCGVVVGGGGGTGCGWRW